MSEHVGNEQAMMAEFADNLWKNYIKPKYEATRQDKVSYYRATVISNNGDGTLTVRPACDNERTVNHTSELSNIEAGAEVVVWKLGNGNAAMNHLAVLTYSDGGGGALGEKTITENGTYYATQDGYAGYSQVTVEVPIGLKTILGGSLASGNVVDFSALAIRSYAGFNNSGLTGIYAKLASTIGESAFQACSKLSYAEIPLCTNVADFAFYGCSSLEHISLSLCSFIGINSFRSCFLLREAYMPVCEHIGQLAFAYCYVLSTLNLSLVEQVTELEQSAFEGARLFLSVGSVLVPSNLYSEFITATNWASISSRIVAV